MTKIKSLSGSNTRTNFLSTRQDIILIHLRFEALETDLGEIEILVSTQIVTNIVGMYARKPDT